MNNNQLLIQILAVDCDNGKWVDYWLGEAIPLIQDAKDSEWQELRSMWHLQSEKWQIRFATVVPFGESTEAFNILVEMLFAKFPSVAIRAAESIKSIGRFDFPNINSVVIRLSQLREAHTSKLDEISITDFLEALKE